MQVKKYFWIVSTLIILLSAPSAFAASVTLRWQANNEPDIAGYRVYYGTRTRTYGLPISIGNVTSYTIGNLNDGVTYYFSISALDTAGNESGFSSEISTTTSTAPSPQAPDPKSVALSTNMSSPQVSGTTINFTASAQGGSGSYEYRFYEYNASTNKQWVQVRDFATNPSYSWNSSGKVGTGYIGVWARNAGGQNFVYGFTSFTIQAVAKLSGVTIQASVPSPQVVGNAITFTASPKGGTGSTEYRFYEYNAYTNKKWVIVRDYSTNPSFTWNSAGKIGTTQIGVWARSVGSQQPVYGSANYSIQDIPKPTNVAISPNISSPRQEGTNISFTAIAQGGTGSYEYRFYEYNASTGNQWQMVRDFSSRSSFTWNSTGKPGRTYIGVWARSAGGQGYVYSYSAYLIQ